MANLLRTGVLLGLGAINLTREKAEQMVEELVKAGEVQREEGQRFAQELLARGEKERQELNDNMRKELGKLLAQADLVTKKDLTRIEERVAVLEQRLMRQD